MMSAQVTPSHGLKFAAPRPNVAMERFAVRCAIGGHRATCHSLPWKGSAVRVADDPDRCNLLEAGLCLLAKDWRSELSE
jgi:hypothetical protein